MKRKSLKYIYLILMLFLLSGIGLGQVVSVYNVSLDIESGTQLVTNSFENHGSNASLILKSPITISGDFINTNSAELDNQGDNAITFDGNTTQNIQSNGNSFHNIVINNTATSAGINLLDNMTITGALDLQSGIISTGEYKISLSENANILNGGNNSFVDGELERTGTSEFTFHIGDISNIEGSDVMIYCPITTAECSSTTNISASYHYGLPPYYDQEKAAGINHISNLEYWIVETNNEHPDITLEWTDNTGDIHGFGNESGTMPNSWAYENLTIAHYNSNLGIWENMGIDVPEGQTNDFSNGKFINTQNYNSYSPITIGYKKDEGMLPIELTKFEAECNAKGIVIQWETASEINNEAFVIQKTNNFREILDLCRIEGNGNSNSTSSYEYIDYNSQSSAYYRLVQYDFNGKSTTYPWKAVECNNIESYLVSIYPNPCKDKALLMVENANNTKISVQIHNLTGKELSNFQGKIKSDKHSIPINIKSITPGIYTLSIHIGKYHKVLKLIKQ